MSNIKSPKKLIEVALPLDDINAAAAREKSIRHGHPSTLHLWWARRPLAAARAVLFAQMVNDPGGERGYFAGKTKAQADAEREKLFDIIRDLVKWENTNNEEVLERARAEIRKSWRETCELNKGKPGFDPDKLPAFHDPFAGGGAIPLEAQRLGLESYASDLNPVAVLINKAMIEIPPKFAGREPVGPLPEGERQGNLHEDWSGAKGLAEDVRRYGHWMREQAEKRIGHLYPKVKVTAEMARNPANPRPDLEPYVGEELTVIAWLWVRTVKSPNPAFDHVDVPLASSFVLSSKKGKEVWVNAAVNADQYSFEIRIGKPPQRAKDGTAAGKRGGFNCLISGSPIDYKYIRTEGQAKRIGQKLMAIVAEGRRGRVYLPPIKEHENLSRSARPSWKPDTPLHGKCRVNVSNYGLDVYGDVFTPRQLVALTTFSDLVGEAREKVIADAKVAGIPCDDRRLDDGGVGATAYGDALAVYFTFALDRLAMSVNSLVRWNGVGEKAQHCFGRQALPMLWDFADVNIIGTATGSIKAAIAMAENPISFFPTNVSGVVQQSDAARQLITDGKVVSTDPPYYDNIGYADLSDFFYVWARKTLRLVFPSLFATLAVPKAEELVATPYRHGGKDAAERFFLVGMRSAVAKLAEQSHSAYPVTIYYAFKQAETKGTQTGNTGWETFLEAVISSGFSICGTWPMRTEMKTRQISMGSNALASSIILVCRKRNDAQNTVSRRDFQRQLRIHMPEALETMIGGTSGHSPIAPVDLAQAAIGPGMAIFSQYSAVLNQDGSGMSVHDALILINREITEFLTPEAGDFDADTLFCNAWFEQYGWSKGKYGEALVLASGKGTTVDGVHASGVIESGAGNVRLLRWKEYPANWDPASDDRTPVWEAAHHMIRALNEAGESGAGALLAAMPEKGEPIRQLAYYLYTLCERKKWAEDARAYNELVGAWHNIIAASYETGHRGAQAEFEL